MEKHDLKKLSEYIKEKYGEDTLILPGTKHEFYSTGSIGLDIAIGGGLPKGRICDYYGLPSAGKSMLSLSAIAQVQKNNGVCAYIDAENAFDERWAKVLGVDLSPERLIRINPSHGEQVFDLTEEFIKCGIDLIVIDSTAALIPLELVERSMEDASLIGLQARLISKGLQKITPLVSKAKSIVLFVNQVRKNIGGNPYLREEESPTGGLALGFYSSVRIKITRKEPIKEKDILLGHRIHCLVKKNKISPPLKEATFDLYYDKGIDNISELFDAAINLGIIVRPPDSIKYHYGDVVLKGQEKVKEWIKGDPKVQEELIQKITSLLK